MTTANMSLNEPTVGQTTGPTWATETNSNWESIDTHDHTSGKGVQLTPSALNINSDLEFNLNSVTELKNVVLDNTVHSSGSGDTNVSLYVYDGNFYYRNASGIGVQITSGSGVNTSGGSIDNMTTNAQVNFSSNSYSFKFDKTLSDPGMAKMAFADIDLYKYNSSGSAAKVALKFLGSGTTAALTVPDETGTLLSTATSFAGTINIATSSSNAPINLKPNGTGHVAVGNGGASGKLTSNGAYDLVLDTNSGTNSGNITITDGTNGEITIDTHGTGDINLTAGADVNIPANIGLTFGDDGEKIEGDGTDLTVASSGALNLTATTDVVVPANVGVTFGTGEKIEGDNTDLTLTSGADINLTATADVNLPNNVGLVFGDDGEKIEGDGTDLTIASSGEINLNSGTLDLSAQTVDVTLNGAVDALNFDSNTLSIDASNNRVGIKQAAPGSLLTIGSVSDNNSGNTPLGKVAQDPVILINNSSHVNSESQILFGYNSGSETYAPVAISYKNTSASSKGKGDLLFATRDATTDSAPTERMRIDSSGNVGIGTNAPSDLNSAANDLVVKNTGNAGITIFSGTTSSGNLFFADATSGTAEYDGFLQYSQNDQKLDIGTAGASRMTITSSGNVDIGGASHAARRFSIKGTANDNSENTIEVLNSDSTTIFKLLSDGDLHIPSGKVGIGTTSPSVPLEVRSTTETPFKIYQTGTGGGQNLYLNMENDGGGDTYISMLQGSSQGYIKYSDTNVMSFMTNGMNDRMRIDSSGHVIVGTSQIGSALFTVNETNGGMSIGNGTASGEYRKCYFYENGNMYWTNGTNEANLSSAGAWTNASDERIKKEINDIDYGLDTVLNCQPRKYKMRDTDQKQIGFVAQEIKKLIPEVVEGGDLIKETGEKRFYSLDYGSLVAVCFKAIQELSAKVTALEGAK
jgi:hypothetical protein